MQNKKCAQCGANVDTTEKCFCGNELTTVFIAGKITDSSKEYFDKAEKHLREKGYQVLNPAFLPYMSFSKNYIICCAMMDVCDAVYIPSEWSEDPEVRNQYYHAVARQYKIIFEVKES
jgi:hypothetical protein